MKVKHLKRYFNRYLETLDRYEDDLEVPLRSNNYGLDDEYMAWNDGFLDLSNLKEVLDNAEEGNDEEG